MKKFLLLLAIVFAAGVGWTTASPTTMIHENDTMIYLEFTQDQSPPSQMSLIIPSDTVANIDKTIIGMTATTRQWCDESDCYCSSSQPIVANNTSNETKTEKTAVAVQNVLKILLPATHWGEESFNANDNAMTTADSAETNIENLVLRFC